MRPVSISILAAAAVTFLAATASAETTTATGSRIMKDAYGTQTKWGRSLKLPEDGKVVRVMYGTYGFSIVDQSGNTVGDFLLPEMAVGTELAAGEYQIVPYVCAKHRHHHVEVTVEY
ncbi:hypothetical protein [Parvibaculum sp.]|uniref:hypothetical protein n=1 Tax=Parvibaculum sp. TaxID=2024848 RepID=UPI000ECA1363|nr:hypothetical protein [Parvibaculum sp.]MBO6669392.1 hypothetical protein [Parvibaculum sp.]MBO6692795.1 hypothetical protein [Parvibaculum sp.]MBO6715093.1 hypothetical protein [Parvibaculum sp.]HAC57304.1 hypothetical protein [Rhodobiaceae bacterium]